MSVHPRVRGDMNQFVGIPVDAVGSPPRARGHVAVLSSERDLYRFTPACAGTWRLRGSFPLRIAVHPRVRGDMGAFSAHRLNKSRFTPACAGTWLTNGNPVIMASGSPPRARGHVELKVVHRRQVRFTPACAGTWRSPVENYHEFSVHPRVRGDMHGYIRRRRAVCGSPPRARGHGAHSAAHA